MAMSLQNTSRILILGGGFGGVATARGLSKLFRGDGSVEVTLVNRDNYFVFVPMLASAAAGSIETLHTVAPIRPLIPGVRFRAEEVIAIDLEKRSVATASPVTGREHRLPYDHLVLALGNVINLTRLPGVAQHGKTIKTLGDALAIRNHVLQMLEAADIETDPVVRREMLTFVVTGGGFSGVEMVGELNDLVREAISHYPSITEDQVRVILLHSQDRILPEMGPGIADYALKQLRKRGVEVRLKSRLAGATPHEVLIEGGPKIVTRTLIVAVGNAPPPVLDGLDVKKSRGKIVVDEFMRVAERPGVWALGDNAIVPNRASESGSPSPPTAQYALRQGKALAHNIAATLRGQPPKPFAFGGLGLLCLVGHGSGVGELPLGIKVKGFLGWFLWRSVYWSKAPSFGRKVQIGMDWLLDLFLERDIAQINLSRTQTVGRAHYEPGEYVFRQWEPGNHFYLIAEGEVEVIREHSSGERTVLARLGKGEYFGETALLTRGRRNASVRCATPVDVITIGRDDFATLAGAWQQLASNLTEASERRVAATPLTTFLPVLNTSDIPEISGEEPPVTDRSPHAAQLRRDSGAEIALDRELISLGRGPDNHVVVADPRASRRHALIQREGDAYWLDDLESQNGTWLNGTRVTERAALESGDEIRIGRTRFVFEIGQTSSGTARTGKGSVTEMIRGLDVGQGEPKVGQVTGVIEGLDKPKHTPEPPEESLESAAPGRSATEVSPDFRAQLEAISGPTAGETFEVGSEEITIGRSPENKIRLFDERVSRQHAKIEPRDGAYWLTDLGSRNGTYVNQARLTAPHRLRPGDVIGVGQARFVFEVAKTVSRSGADSPEVGSVTGMIESLDKPRPKLQGPKPRDDV
jgi:NADH:ubiquinone reductase (H+-translocating)